MSGGSEASMAPFMLRASSISKEIGSMMLATLPSKGAWKLKKKFQAFKNAMQRGGGQSNLSIRNWPIKTKLNLSNQYV